MDDQTTQTALAVPWIESDSERALRFELVRIVPAAVVVCIRGRGPSIALLAIAMVASRTAVEPTDGILVDLNNRGAIHKR
jgi:hypothetical protein